MLPLSGIKVVEWTGVVAGPTAGMILANLGTDSIVVDRPGARYSSDSKHRNKRSIAINLKEREGVEIMHKLLQNADIFLENFSPGATEKLGFGYDTISKINPKIIYCSIKGYGKGPYEMMPAYDPVIEAASGIMSLQGEKGGAPVRYGGALIDIAAAQHSIIAIMGALLNREKTGKGDKITVGMFEGAMSILQPYLTLYLLYGIVRERMGSGSGASQCFKTKDRWVYIDADNDVDWLKLCDILGINEKEKREYATDEVRRKNPERVEQIVSGAISKLSLGEVLEKLREVDVPHAPVNTSKEVAEDPHLKATKSLTTYITAEKEPRIGVCVSLPLRTSYYNPQIEGWEGRRVPKPGEHTTEVLNELGYTAEQITDLRNRKVVWS